MKPRNWLCIRYTISVSITHYVVSYNHNYQDGRNPMETTWRRTYNRGVFTSRFNDLRRKKAYAEGRDLSLRQVARESGVSLSTLQRINRQQLSRLNLATVDQLCRYFGVRSVAELIEFVPDPVPPEKPADHS